MAEYAYCRLLVRQVVVAWIVTCFGLVDATIALGDLAIHENIVGREGFEIQTDGIFAVWWDQPFDHSDETGELFSLLNDIRTDVANNLGLGDPPNPAAGYYYNVFIHHGEDDRFPNDWGNGQGFGPQGLPYLTLPAGAHEDVSNVLHEGFHVFQTSSAYDVVDTNPDAVWIIEASAEWYQSSRNSDDPRAFITAGSAYALPHLSLWYMPENSPPTVDPSNDWLYGVKPYAMSVFLHYLTNVESVDRAIIPGVYSTNSPLTAQEYIFNAVGGDNLRNMFADWAARTAVGLDYLTEEQLEVTMDELDFFTDPDEVHAHAIELTGGQANGTFSPELSLQPGGWAYNAIKIDNSADLTYTFDIRGDATGSQGAASHFEARLAVVNGVNVTYQDVLMTDSLSGQISYSTTSADSELYLVISAVPDYLMGNQTYDYEVDITTSTEPIPNISADFDGDGRVTGLDFLAWQANFSIDNGATRVQGDADGNGTVDASDLAIWRAQHGGLVANATNVIVPEPTAFVLALVSICLFFGFRI